MTPGEERRKRVAIERKPGRMVGGELAHLRVENPEVGRAGAKHHRRDARRQAEQARTIRRPVAEASGLESRELPRQTLVGGGYRLCERVACAEPAAYRQEDPGGIRDFDESGGEPLRAANRDRPHGDDPEGVEEWHLPDRIPQLGRVQRARVESLVAEI